MNSTEYKAYLYDEMSKVASESGFMLDVLIKEHLRMRDSYVDKTTYYEIAAATSKEDLLEGRYRTMGVIEDLDKAKSLVVHNQGDLFEYTYTYVGVIAYHYGLFNYPKFKLIYKYNEESEGFDFIEKYNEFNEQIVDKNENLWYNIYRKQKQIGLWSLSYSVTYSFRAVKAFRVEPVKSTRYTLRGGAVGSSSGS